MLRERGARRVGAELGGGMRDRHDGQRSRARCAPTWRASSTRPGAVAVRAIKSQAEAERVRTACAITSAAYAAVLPTLRPGMTEREWPRGSGQAMAERGADSSWVWVVERARRVRSHRRSRRAARALDRGDLVFVDMGACVGGYWADFSRAAVIGRASEHQREMQQLIAEVTMIGTTRSRSGTHDGRGGPARRRRDGRARARVLERGRPLRPRTRHGRHRVPRRGRRVRPCRSSREWC